jgi:hypothetical protein
MINIYQDEMIFDTVEEAVRAVELLHNLGLSAEIRKLSNKYEVLTTAQMVSWSNG